jgi:hypothetical protein
MYALLVLYDKLHDSCRPAIAYMKFESLNVKPGHIESTTWRSRVCTDGVANSTTFDMLANRLPG